MYGAEDITSIIKSNSAIDELGIDEVEIDREYIRVVINKPFSIDFVGYLIYREVPPKSIIDSYHVPTSHPRVFKWKSD